MTHRDAAGLCVLAVAWTAGCAADPDPAAVLLGDSSGVPIATPRELPPLLSEAHLWRVRILETLPTEPRPGEEPIVFNPTAVLPLSDGALLVVDGGGEWVLHVLNPSRGTVQGRFGRRGEGPGELSGYPVVWEDTEGRIHAADPANRKTLTFGREGTLLDERRLTVGAGGFVRAHGVGRLLWERLVRQEGVGMTGVLTSVAPARDTAEAFAALPPYEPEYLTTGNLQKGRPVWATLGEHVVIARTDVASFRVHDGEGELLRLIRLPLTRRRLTELDLAREVAEVGGLARNLSVGPIAITNALYSFSDTAFAMLQGRLWRAAEDPPMAGRTTVWRLVSVNGFPMGTVVWPQDASPLWVGDGEAWVLAYDDLGRPVLRHLALEPPEGVGW